MQIGNIIAWLIMMAILISLMPYPKMTARRLRCKFDYHRWDRPHMVYRMVERRYVYHKHCQWCSAVEEIR